ncbi:hypothetical protein [Fundidesulfovibrio putealis]|uniref:hypothetical protein n=1 Tax=Fundidesulfovibrio putealis TaxID=270496 RepID=UPI000484BBC1|nr:hypothetical protein [Fundidesulfovibrio putealis]KAF0234918.1 MAG: hypothetical protein FD177_481 [Desulfovibrionaceae bacterium]
MSSRKAPKAREGQQEEEQAESIFLRGEDVVAAIQAQLGVKVLDDDPVLLFMPTAMNMLIGKFNLLLRRHREEFKELLDRNVTDYFTQSQAAANKIGQALEATSIGAIRTILRDFRNSMLLLLAIQVVIACITVIAVIKLR